MRAITKEELDVIIQKHHDWLEGKEGGLIADLSYASLRYANLSEANLRYANLSYANLRNASLSNANLSDANLSNANLSYANLSYANLRYANLSEANLRHCIADEKGLSGRSLRGLQWPVHISPDFKTLSIGCQTHAVSDWKKWTTRSLKIKAMHTEAPAFWAKHKAKILALCEP